MKNFFLLLLLSIALLFSCSGRKGTSSESDVDSLAQIDSTIVHEDSIQASEPPTVKIEKDTLLDNAARFIAGLPQLNENNFAQLQKDKYWKEYQSSMDANWKKMYDSRLSKMAAWEQSTFSKSIEDSLTLFYPFSGPDFLHAFFLFPRSKEYVLAALEPIREVVPLDTIGVKDRDAFLDSLIGSC